MNYYQVHELMTGPSQVLKIEVKGTETDHLINRLPFILQKVPAADLLDIVSNCIFMMNRPPAIYISSQVLEGKSIIWIYEAFFEEEKENQEHIVLHEVAHYVLKHNTEVASDEEYEKQEREANALVRRWQNDFEKYRK